jgi:peptidyl-prolyl cis-trans isomerase C
MSRDLKTPGPRRRGFRALGVALFLLTASGFLLPLVLGGCGSKSDENLVVATVGDKEITLGYYEDRLGKLEADELPRDEDGLPIDTASLDGKRAFLDVIINKELMALKAEDLGYHQEQQVAGAEKSMLEYNMGFYLHRDVIEEPANFVSEEELADYHSKLGQKRVVSFLITNFEEDAEQARQALLEGRLWQDVAEEFHDGSQAPDGTYQVTIPWGRFDDTFEKAVFDLEEGQISPPVETVYGYWIMRLENVLDEPVEDLSDMRDRVLSSIRMRKINLARKTFMAELHDKYQFQIFEDGLWAAYQGLPADEQIFKPGTREPVPRDQLKPLDVPAAERDMPLYSVIVDGEPKLTTVGDFKEMFDSMNVFQRPKTSEMLGGLRQRITQDIDRMLVIQEARARGYDRDPRVLDAVEPKVEEMMVSKLHDEVVDYDEYVGPEELESFFAEHEQDYVKPESREGMIVYCGSLDSARKARNDALAGRAWSEILAEYGVNDENKEAGGVLDAVPINSRNPIKDAVFSLAELGDVCEPFNLNNQWVVIRLDGIDPERQQELEEVREIVGQRIRMRRQDEALRQLLEEWRNQYGVQVRTENLAKARSWNELSVAAAAEE